MPPLLPDIDRLAARLGLHPHPEGGMYAETYRSRLRLPAQVLSPDFSAARSASTAILFLLPRGCMSRLHRIRSDELWHFHLGGPLTVHELAPDGATRSTVLGPDILAGQAVQHMVPAGSWFGAMPCEGAPTASSAARWLRGSVSRISSWGAGTNCSGPFPAPPDSSAR